MKITRIFGVAAALAGSALSQATPDPDELDARDGTDRILTRAEYEKLSYRGLDVGRDAGMTGVEFVKFTIDALDTDDPKLYFINTMTHRSHPGFARSIGLRMSTKHRGSSFRKMELTMK